MRLSSATPPPAATNEEDPNALASQLRIKEEALAANEAHLAEMIPNLRALHPAFDTAWGEVHRLREEIPKVVDRLKALARTWKRSLDLASHGYEVAFADPMSESVDPKALGAMVPDLAQRCPDVLIVKTEVDLKALRVAVAAGVLPGTCLELIKKTPTTKDGRVELKRLGKKVG